MTKVEASMVEPVAPPLRILLVEDDEFDVAVFGRAFRRGKIACEIVRCRSGEEALAGLRDAELELDLLITDHQLPGMPGFDLCLELIDRYRSAPSGRTEPPYALVLLTGVGSEQMAIRALRAGINDYIVKDGSREYLDLLPLVLPRVARRHRQRRLRRLAEQQQGAPPEAGRAGDTHIGLSACAEAVEHKGGRVWVENHLGQSPALCFRVPLAPDEVAFWTPAREAPEPRPAPTLKTGGDDRRESSGDVSSAGRKPPDHALESENRLSLHVLIVHPNPIVTFVARRTVERMGHRCAAVESGAKNLEALDREPFDLVLIALDMPGLDGLETVRRIRRRKSNSGGRVPILALGAAPGAEERCREASIDGVIAAPVSAYGLKVAIEGLE